MFFPWNSPIFLKPSSLWLNFPVFRTFYILYITKEGDTHWIQYPTNTPLADQEKQPYFTGAIKLVSFLSHFLYSYNSFISFLLTLENHLFSLNAKSIIKFSYWNHSTRVICFFNFIALCFGTWLYNPFLREKI